MHISLDVSKDDLIGEYIPLAHDMAKEYRDQGVPLEDLKQEALLGLVKAVNRYTSSETTYWTTAYAKKSIRNALKDAVREAKMYKRAEIPVGHKADMDFIINNDLDRKPGRATSPDPDLSHITHRVKNPDGTYSFNGKPEVPEILNGVLAN